MFLFSSPTKGGSNTQQETNLPQQQQQSSSSGDQMTLDQQKTTTTATEAKTSDTATPEATATATTTTTGTTAAITQSTTTNTKTSTTTPSDGTGNTPSPGLGSIVGMDAALNTTKTTFNESPVVDNDTKLPDVQQTTTTNELINNPKTTEKYYKINDDENMNNDMTAGARRKRPAAKSLVKTRRPTSGLTLPSIELQAWKKQHFVKVPKSPSSSSPTKKKYKRSPTKNKSPTKKKKNTTTTKKESKKITARKTTSTKIKTKGRIFIVKKSTKSTTTSGSSGKKSGSSGKKSGSRLLNVEIWRGKPDEKIPEGWPNGWIKTIEERKSKSITTKGRQDRYWYTPKEKIRLRSVVDCRRFIKALTKTKGDEVKAKSIMKNMSL